MKNVLPIARPGDIRDHVASLWKTDVFRAAQRDNPLLRALTDRFSRTPRFFAQMSDPRAERGHFSIWWSGVMARDYANPALHDLYLLHEIAHGADLRFDPAARPAAFRHKMLRNELFASAVTEIAVYFALPGLRGMTFAEDIFADRLLENPRLQNLWRADPRRALAAFAALRRRAARNPAENDAPAQWLARFAARNALWFTLWQNDYPAVEAAMARLSAAQDGEAALKHHLDWLSSPAVSRGGDIPFPRQARAFAQDCDYVAENSSSKKQRS